MMRILTCVLLIFGTTLCQNDKDVVKDERSVTPVQNPFINYINERSSDKLMSEKETPEVEDESSFIDRSERMTDNEEDSSEIESPQVIDEDIEKRSEAEDAYFNDDQEIEDENDFAERSTDNREERSADQEIEERFADADEEDDISSDEEEAERSTDEEEERSTDEEEERSTDEEEERSTDEEEERSTDKEEKRYIDGEQEGPTDVENKAREPSSTSTNSNLDKFGAPSGLFTGHLRLFEYQNEIKRLKQTLKDVLACECRVCWSKCFRDNPGNLADCSARCDSGPCKNSSPTVDRLTKDCKFKEGEEIGLKKKIKNVERKIQKLQWTSKRNLKSYSVY